MKHLYIQPTMLAVELQHKSGILTQASPAGATTVSTNLTGDDVVIYTDQSSTGSARVKEQNVWDEEW